MSQVSNLVVEVKVEGMEKVAEAMKVFTDAFQEALFDKEKLDNEFDKAYAILRSSMKDVQITCGNTLGAIQQ